MKQLIDFLFLSIFGISLILPICFISKETISKQENRVLTPYKSLYDTQKKKFNFKYGTDLDAFLKDHFYGRKKLIYSYRNYLYYIAYRIAKLGTTTFDKKEKWIWEHLLATGVDDKTMKQIVEQFKLFNSYCEKNNIKFYPVVMPRKESVYTPAIVNRNHNPEIKKSLSYINERAPVHIIFPLDELLAEKEKSSLLYHKTDHHATMDGTWIGYQVLMKTIQKDFSDISIQKKSDFHSFNNKKVKSQRSGFGWGSTCNSAGISSRICEQFLNVDYRYYTHKNETDLKIESITTNTLVRRDYFYPKGKNLKVLVFGDSFSENLMHILPYSFQHVTLIRLNGPEKIPRNNQMKILKYYQSEIEKIKPDIIVIYVFYSLLPKFRDLSALE